jgi:hypothetical protein
MKTRVATSAFDDIIDGCGKLTTSFIGCANLKLQSSKLFNDGGSPNKVANDTPPKSLMDSTTNPKVKITKGEGVGARSLARSTLGVEGHARALGWGLRRMTSKSITHTDLHKPNNKLVNA